MKWLFLAIVCAVLAILILVIGLFRSSSISKTYASTEEEKQANIEKGRKVFLRHTVVAVILIAIAIIIRVATGGTAV